MFLSVDGSEDSLQRDALHRGRVEHVIHRVLQAARSIGSLPRGGMASVRDRQVQPTQDVIQVDASAEETV